MKDQFYEMLKQIQLHTKPNDDWFKPPSNEQSDYDELYENNLVDRKSVKEQNENDNKAILPYYKLNIKGQQYISKIKRDYCIYIMTVIITIGTLILIALTMFLIKNP